MPIDPQKSPYRFQRPLRDTPATRAVKLTSTMVNDSEDLSSYPKAMRIYNGLTQSVTMLVTLADEPSDLVNAAVPITLPSGTVKDEPIGVRRIWSTGSTRLVAGLNAGTVEVVLYTL